jgi:hypothetical protein
MNVSNKSFIVRKISLLLSNEYEKLRYQANQLRSVCPCVIERLDEDIAYLYEVQDRRINDSPDEDVRICAILNVMDERFAYMKNMFDASCKGCDALTEALDSTK